MFWGFNEGEVKLCKLGLRLKKNIFTFSTLAFLQLLNLYISGALQSLNILK